MARARNIKPGFYKNEDLAECSIWARFIFPGLWMMADREGRLEDRPRRIKAELLPFDSQDAEPLLKELEARSFIIRYQNSDGSFIQISKFKEHQAPHYSEKPSVIKPHDFQETTDHEGIEKPDNSGKEASLRGGRNPLNPSSLNPESLHTDSAPDGFDLFWKTYPKKKAKPAAAKAFKAQKINGELPIILADIEQQAQSADWQKEGGQFVPYPATYLNERRWEDGASESAGLGTFL